MAGLATRSLTGSGFFFVRRDCFRSTSSNFHPPCQPRLSGNNLRKIPESNRRPRPPAAARRPLRVQVRSAEWSATRQPKNQTGPRPALPSPAARGLAIRIDMGHWHLPPADSPFELSLTGRDCQPDPKATGPAPTVASPAPAKHGTGDAKPGPIGCGIGGPTPAMRRGMARRPGGFDREEIDQDQERGGRLGRLRPPSRSRGEPRRRLPPR
jgi:hypothetical protein